MIHSNYSDLQIQFTLWSKACNRTLHLLDGVTDELIGYTNVQAKYYCIFRNIKSPCSMYARYYWPEWQGKEYTGAFVSWTCEDDRMILDRVTHTHDCPVEVVIALIEQVKVEAYNSNTPIIYAEFQKFDYTAIIEQALNLHGFTDDKRGSCICRETEIEIKYRVTFNRARLIRRINIDGHEYRIERTNPSSFIYLFRIKEGRYMRGMVRLAYDWGAAEMKILFLKEEQNKEEIIFPLTIYVILTAVNLCSKHLTLKWNEEDEPIAVYFAKTLKTFDAELMYPTCMYLNFL